MKRKSFFISTIMTTLFLVFNSCTLFIDDDNLFEGKTSTLPKYEGEGYDKPVTEVTEFADITYQLQENTMTLNADDELSKYIIRTDTLANMKMIYFNKSVPRELLPQIGQIVVSGNTDLFEYGMCDFVYGVDEKEGEIVVSTVLTDYTNAYKELKISAHPNIREIMTSFEVYDEDGNYLGEVNQEELRQLKASAKRAKGISQLSTDDDGEEVDYDISFKLLNDIVKTTILPLVKGPVLKEDPKPGLNTDISISGGVVLPKIDMDVNLSLFSDYNLYVDASVGEGFVDFFLDMRFGVGMKSPRWYSFIPKKFEKIKSAFRTGAIVWDIFLNWGFQLDCNLSVKPRFRYPFGGKRIKVLDAKVSDLGGLLKESSFWFDELGMSGDVDFPMLLLNIGAGIGTDDVTLNVEIILRNRFTGHVDFIDRSYIEDKLNLGLAVVLRGKGSILSKLLNKIREKIYKKFPNLLSFMEMEAANYVEEYLASGTLEEWAKYEIGDYSSINPDRLKAMEAWAKEKFLTIEEWKDLDSFDRKQNMAKVKEIKTIQNARSEEQKKHRQKKAKSNEKSMANPENGNKDFEWRIGPWWPKLTEWTLLPKRYCEPKIMDNTFKVGAKWEYVGGDKQLVFVPEYRIKDIGLDTKFSNKKWKPGFRILLGSEVIHDVELDDNHFITESTMAGVKYSTKLQGMSWLDAEETFVCEPYFRRYDEDKRTDKLTFESGLAFSPSTPAMSITKFKVANAKYEVKNDANEFSCNIIVYVSIKGMQNIAGWGIRDDYDDNSSTKYHTNKDAVGVSEADGQALNAGQGTFMMTFSLKSSKIITDMCLTPYIIPRGQDVNNKDKAKFFSQWNQQIDFSKYIQGSGYSNSSGFDDYTLTLESVEYILLDDDETEEQGETYDYEE